MKNYPTKPFLYWLSLALITATSCWQCQTQELPPVFNSLLSITFDQVPILSTANDPTTQNWTLTVPYQTNLHQLKPILILTQGSTVVPRSGQIQDFTKPVFYTVTTQEGNKTVFQLIVRSQSQLAPQLTALSADTLEAGQSIGLTGHHFGSFGLDIQVIATSPANLTTLLTTTLLDSTHIRAELPFNLLPGHYRLKVQVRNLPSPSVSLHVQYPSPQLVRVDRYHLRSGDTLRVSGLYIKPSIYDYSLQMTRNGSSQHQWLNAFSPIDNGFAVKTDTDLLAGRYRIQAVNRSERKVSRDTTLVVELYDPAKPFITGIINPKTTYLPDESILIKTVNFGRLASRFYQLQLTGMSRNYSVNGIYNPAQQQLTLTLPADIIKGVYTISTRLLDSEGQIIYRFETDERFTVR